MTRGEPQIRPVPPNRRALIYLYSRSPFLLRRAEQLATTLFAAESNQGQETLVQLHFLQILSISGVTAQAQLARLCGSDTSTASLILQNLGKRKLVERRPDPEDRRQKLVAIAPQGRALLEAAEAVLERVDTALLAPLGAGAGRLVDLLAKIASTPLASPAWAGATSAGDVAGPELSKIYSSPAFLLRRALQVMDAIASGELTSIGVTIRQFAAMLVIFSHPGVGEADLIRYAGFEASNASFILKLLVRDGHVEPYAERGARKRYRITPDGWDMLHTAGPALVRAERALLGSLTVGEAADVRALLAEIIAGHNRGASASLPLFGELFASPQWPIEAGEMDFETIASVPRDAEGEAGVQRSAVLHHERQGLLQLVKWAELAIRGDLEKLLRPLDLGPGQLLALGVVADSAGLSATDLARLMGMTPQSIASLLSPLIERGLIARRADTDNMRRLRLFLLPSGKRVLAAGHDAIAPLEAKLLASLSSTNYDIVRGALLELLARSGGEIRSIAPAGPTVTEDRH